MPSPNVHTPAGAQRTGFRELTHVGQRVGQTLTSFSGTHRVSPNDSFPYQHD